jgi:hypothetical protein
VLRALKDGRFIPSFCPISRLFALLAVRGAPIPLPYLRFSNFLQGTLLEILACTRSRKADCRRARSADSAIVVEQDRGSKFYTQAGCNNIVHHAGGILNVLAGGATGDGTVYV